MVNLISPVQNLCITLRKSLWEIGGKEFHRPLNYEFCTIFVAKVGLFHDLVEKFYRYFYTRFYRYQTEFYTLSTALTTTTTKYLERTFK